MQNWTFKTVLRLIAIVGVMAGMLFMLACSAVAQDGNTAPQCKVAGAQLVSYEYSPVTGVARGTFTHSIGGVVQAEGFARADLSMTENQAEKAARMQVLKNACTKLASKIQNKITADRR